MVVVVQQCWKYGSAKVQTECRLQHTTGCHILTTGP